MWSACSTSGPGINCQAISEREEGEKEERKKEKKRMEAQIEGLMECQTEQKWTLRVARGWHTLAKVILNWTDRSCIMASERIPQFLIAPIASGAGRRERGSPRQTELEKTRERREKREVSSCHLMW